MSSPLLAGSEVGVRGAALRQVREQPEEQDASLTTRYRALYSREVLLGLRHTMRNHLSAIRNDLRAVPPSDQGGLEALRHIEREIDAAEKELKHAEVTCLSSRASRRFEECLTRVCAALGSSAARLQTELGGESAAAVVPADLDVVLLALVENALEASADPVQVTADVLGLDLKVSISNPGPGIPAQARAAVFRRGMTTKAGHLGYGLPLAAHLAEQISASVGLTSRDDEGVEAILHVRITP